MDINKDESLSWVIFDGYLNRSIKSKADILPSSNTLMNTTFNNSLDKLFSFFSRHSFFNLHKIKTYIMVLIKHDY